VTGERRREAAGQPGLSRAQRPVKESNARGKTSAVGSVMKDRRKKDARLFSERAAKTKTGAMQEQKHGQH